MGRKVGIELEDVVDAATEIADKDGLDATTLSAVARQLGIKTPSLYNHVEGVDGLRRRLAMRGSEVLLDEIRRAAAGRSGVDALREIARADRAFALKHPGLYESFLPAPTEQGDPELYDVMARPVFAIAQVLLDMGIPQDQAVHLIRALRATLHGFLDLEAKDGFGMPVNIDDSFDAAVDLMLAGIEAAAEAGQRG
jgi:AcrR family transcriptional regulator